MLQDLLGHVYAPLGRTSWMPGVIVTSAAIVLAWGYFLIRACAIRWAASTRSGRCSASPTSCSPRSRSAWRRRSCSRCTARATCGSRCAPLAWLLIVTFTAALAEDLLAAAARRLPGAGDAARSGARRGRDRRRAGWPRSQAVIFNARLDAVVCGIFLVLVTTILIDSMRLWIGILRGTRPAQIRETAFVPTQLGPEESW